MGRSIIVATQDLLAEVGYDALTIEGVADRAAVGKTTVYRRWANKEELVLAAIEDFYQDMQVPDTGDLRADLVTLLRTGRRVFTESKAGEVLPHLAPHLARRTTLGQAYLTTVMGPRVEALQHLLREGQERGHVRDDADLDLMVASLIGAMMFLLLTGRIEDQPPDLAERITDQVLDGILVRSEP